MPFPLPLNSSYRKEIIWAWIGDVEDRVNSQIPGAEASWKIACEIYLSLPPGEGCDEIESALALARSILDRSDQTGKTH